MKLHYLRYFAVLAEELHFSRAAQRLSITQPPLSNAIKALEQELGVRLMERDSKRVELTPAGAAFLEEVRPILDRINSASKIAKAVASGIQGTLDIGVAGSLIYRGVPEIVNQFGREIPEVELNLLETASGEQVQALLQGHLHAGFMNAATVPSQLDYIALPDDVFVLCLPEAHAMARHKSVDLWKLREEKFVMFARNIAPANHDNVIAILRRAGFAPKTVHAARQWLTIIAMVSKGLGVALVPKSLAHSNYGGIRFVAIGGEPVTSQALFAWNPGNPSPALTPFIDCVRRFCAKAQTGRSRMR